MATEEIQLPQQQGGPARPEQSEGQQESQQQDARIAVREDDEDSAYSDAASSATSLMTYLNRHLAENGRLYHAYRQGKYMYPCDEKEQDRLDIHFQMISVALDGKLHLAPIGKHPQRILELATGTGIWAITMGDQYPSAEIIGNELSPIQPKFVPPNVRFEIDDIEDEWLYQDKFDFIFARYLVGAIKDWPRLLRQAYDATEPGGWVEMQDWDIHPKPNDNPLPNDCALVHVAELMADACTKSGREPSPGPKLEGWFRDAGFVDIHHETFRMPLGRWPKEQKMREIGLWNHMQVIEGVEGYLIGPLTRGLGWSPEEVQVLLANVRNEFKDPNLHIHYEFHVVYGRKPGGRKESE